MQGKNLNLSNYLLYLDIIMARLNKFFEEQKEYIFCHRGCAKCCKKAQFPYTEIEFMLLMEGYKLLKTEYQKEVCNKTAKILVEKTNHIKSNSKEKFRYECPFLINNECSVYNFRGLVCRSFGLMTFDFENKNSPKVPFCAFEGLNYSNILDFNTKKISKEMYKKSGFINDPTAHNTDYHTLIDDEIAKSFDFEFGDKKPLIDWLEDTLDYNIMQ